MSDSRVVIVTGARRGLGRTISEHLLGQGFHVVGCGRKPVEWEAEGFTYLQADVTDLADVRRLVKTARDSGHEVYGVVNNAATASMNHSLLTPASSVTDMLGTSVGASFLVSREAVKVMRKNTRGRIVGLSSVAVPLRLEGQAGYVAAKAGLEGLCQVMAKEFAPFGVTVNVIGATPIDTDMIRGVPKDTIAKLVDQFPIKRLGLRRDVTNALDFFLRPESDAVTGQVLYLGGVPNG